MPFPMRIQPIDAVQHDIVKPPVLKSRLKRLFDRPLNSVLRISSATEKHVAREEKDGGAAAAAAPDFEPSSFCLDKMVQNFFEDNTTEKQSSAAGPAKCCRHRRNCFNGNSNSNDSSDDEFIFFPDSSTPSSSPTDSSFTLKSLIPCASMVERNLLADTSFIVESHKISCKRKDKLRKIVADELTALGYDASVCKSKWEKSSSIPAGEYEYVDVITDGGERLIIDVDFRSEFEIARSTANYRSILQNLPSIFVGEADRLLQILSIVAEAARLSLKKEGMHIAPWRKADYMKSKWLGPHTRIVPVLQNDDVSESEVVSLGSGELGLTFGSETTSSSEAGVCSGSSISLEDPKPRSQATVAGDVTWKLPAVRAQGVGRKNKAVVTGLAALLKEKI